MPVQSLSSGLLTFWCYSCLNDDVTCTDVTRRQRLEATTAELKRTAAALEREKEKTDRLLHSMLPPEVAQKLKSGDKVQESFDSATSEMKF